MSSFSIGSWSFYKLLELGKLDLYGYINAMKYRYDTPYLDIWSGMISTLENTYVNELAKTLREEDIQVSNLAVDGADCWHDDPEARKLQEEKAMSYLNLAVKIKAKNVRIDLGLNDTTIDSQAYTNSVQTMKRYAEYALNNGFTVGPQNHQLATQDPDFLLRFSQDVDHDGYGITLNVNRWLTNQSAGDLLIAPYVSHLQFDRAFVDFNGDQLTEKVELFVQQGYSRCWSLEYRGGEDAYYGTTQDLSKLKQVVYHSDSQQ